MRSGPKKPPAHPAGAHKLRIIGGRWRSRTLSFPAVADLRPTGDRIRETLFNWLMPELPGTRCLDLFAGSGILGFEALSRGASGCTLVERHPLAARQLQANAVRLDAQGARIYHGDALEFLKTQEPEPCGIVFLDPPFSAEFWQPALTLLARGWLADRALVYIETPAAAALALEPPWQLHRQKRAGHVCYSLYRHETNFG